VINVHAIVSDGGRRAEHSLSGSKRRCREERVRESNLNVTEREEAQMDVERDWLEA